MRILAVNILSGGNASKTAALVARILRADFDVVVISEYRDNPAGAKLREALRRAGFEHQAATDGHKGNGVLIASTEPLSATRNPFGLSDDEYPSAVMQADTVACGCSASIFPDKTASACISAA